ncbi:hypothetical protein METBIDRAFT_34511 [Metschnikowia bicuspidata var. bicuspidata NRRL YB-4993]|uniref:ARM repeat-containing protein n=1 Tax=Metschnikowia bicuspidata var. bicuspidata NRRL YB-4993 TaxID=869754 RepID=A0A1A0HFV3_9ASCO|nr:hypothetical protein METBIDRAFT_34511 [Metschnikowia bicuspidata var. bicuspidata NRRL YB-4993]OBA23039.1 hypothetical protein METBIDRAFT_34511 [Metschnikowia bicuspidata var. bicuspidata NRRL YB-4993]
MASVAHVTPDLAALSAEARRRHPAVRAAVESAQALAKTLPPSAPVGLSEQTQSVMCAPFLAALDTRSTRVVQAALPALARLAMAGSLADAQTAAAIASLYALDAASQPVDTQLKMLQTLGALAHAPARESAAFVRLVAVCSRLGGSPSAAVANTAAATLQQVLGALYDALRGHTAAAGAALTAARLSPGDTAVPGAAAGPFMLDELELRCFHVAEDLSRACVGARPVLMADRDIRIAPAAALEVLENIVALNRLVFRARPELQAVLAQRTVPALLAVLRAPEPAYPMVVRALRLAQAVVSCGTAGVAAESVRLLAACNRMLCGGAAAAAAGAPEHAPECTAWEKALVAETYHALWSNFATVRALCAHGGPGVACAALAAMDAFLERDFASHFAPSAVPAPGGLPSSAPNTPMLDHLDRTDPPARLPELYAPHVVLRAVLGFADGVSAFVFGLSAGSSAASLEADVDFATALNAAVFRVLLRLFLKFLRGPCDPDSFHLVVRALQRYTHAVGLLGLAAARDALLGLLAACIVEPAPAEDAKRGSAANLLALGESLVESLSSTLPPSFAAARTDAPAPAAAPLPRQPARSFNSRQVICLRAFSNLAVLLGLTLQGSWRIVWATLQWVSYFLKGPDAHGSLSRLKAPTDLASPKLSAQDLAGIKHSHDKLLESLCEYQYGPFCEVYSVLTELYCEEDFPPDSEGASRVALCPFNRSYFLDMIFTLATLDFKNFALIDSDLWPMTSGFFERLATDRSLAPQRRVHIAECYMSIINKVTRQGFKADKDTRVSADRSLDALLGFLEKLLQPGRAHELITLSCETEMHLSVLVTLHGLIDDYDRWYQNSWDAVFKILKTAFINTEEDTLQSTKLVEKIVMLISTSFGSFKMILDEFLLTLPFNQLKSLIDTLMKFCSQKYDLNISFSSVSYFWLISDCIHSNMAKHGEARDAVQLNSIENMHQLEDLLQNATQGTPELYQALNIYLLAKLSHISADERNQVREGAIQTLFQILDVQGEDTQSWQLIYHIVFPELLDLERIDPLAETFSKKNSLPSLNLILSGLVSVYAKFVINFDDDRPIYHEFWTKFIEYMGEMLKMRWLELNLNVFQSFQDVLLSLRGAKRVPKSIITLLFDFWVSVPIDYDFVKPEYQDSLALFNDSFKDLYNLMKDDFAITEATQVLGVLNKCARYPVLKPGTSDTPKPSKLQSVVIENLKLIDKNDDNGEIQATVIQQLAQISAFPYEIKSRIEAKLKSKFEGKLKIPSFVAVGQMAFECISPKLAQVKNLKVLLQEDRLRRMMNDLLNIVRNRAQGVPSDTKCQLWTRCNELILSLANRLVHENLQDFEDDTTIWEVLLECITVTFEESRDEKANVAQYEALADIVLPAFFESKQDELIDQFVQKLYFNSYVYKANETENELMGHGDEYDALTNYQFESVFGTTAKIETEANRQIRMKCLKELFRIASTGGRSAQAAREYIAIRAAFSIRRFIADGRLLGQRPLPQVQEEELMQVLEGFVMMGQAFEAKRMHGLMKLLTRSVVYADRVQGMKDAMQKVLQLGIAS